MYILEDRAYICIYILSRPSVGCWLQGDLWLTLDDGVGTCRALLRAPLLQQILGEDDLAVLARRARQLHGFVQLLEELSRRARVESSGVEWGESGSKPAAAARALLPA